MQMAADTGVLDAARREAAALTSEYATQELQLRRCVDLESRLNQQGNTRRAAGGYQVDDLGLSLSVSQARAQSNQASNAQFQSRFGVSEELAFQRRFDESLGKSLQRNNRQAMSTGNTTFRGTMMNVRDVAELGAGNISFRNLHGAAELGSMALKGTSIGAMLAAAVPGLGAAAMVAVVLAPLLKEMWKTFGGESVNKAMSDWNSAIGATKLIAPGMSAAARGRALGAIRGGIAGDGDTLEERIENGAKKAVQLFQHRVDQVHNSGITAAILSTMRFDRKIQGVHRWVAQSQAGVEDLYATLEQNKMPVTTAIERVQSEFDRIKDREQDQTEFFARHPDIAARFHERLRNDRRIERMRYETQQRDWTDN
jgi:hypothetical protein